MRLDQKGFSAVEILIVIVAITLIGFVGWRVYDSSQSTDEAIETTTQTNEQKDKNTSEESNIESPATISYESEATSLFFSYPAEWGEVSEVNEVERCSNAISEANATVIGNQYSYSFTGASDIEIYISDSNFDITNGVVRCFPDTLRVLDTSSIDDGLIFESKDSKIVFAAADSCIGSVENKYIKAVKTTSSTTYPRVGLDNLSKTKLAENTSVGLCSGTETLDKDGLEYTSVLSAFVSSITINE